MKKKNIILIILVIIIILLVSVGIKFIREKYFLYPKIKIVYVLDVSGSMIGKNGQEILPELIKILTDAGEKQIPLNTEVEIVPFADKVWDFNFYDKNLIKTPCVLKIQKEEDRVKLSKILSEIKDATYKKWGKYTAIYDTVKKVFEKFKSEVDEFNKYKIVLITDGRDNKSKEWNLDQFLKEYKLKKEKYNNIFTFEYIVTNPEAIPEGLDEDAVLKPKLIDNKIEGKEIFSLKSTLTALGKILGYFLLGILIIGIIFLLKLLYETFFPNFDTEILQIENAEFQLNLYSKRKWIVVPFVTVGKNSENFISLPNFLDGTAFEIIKLPFISDCQIINKGETKITITLPLEDDKILSNRDKFILKPGTKFKFKNNITGRFII